MAVLTASMSNRARSMREGPLAALFRRPKARRRAAGRRRAAAEAERAARRHARRAATPAGLPADAPAARDERGAARIPR